MASNNHSGKNDRKWEAREKARLMREEAARQAKRRRNIWIGSSVGGGIVIIAAIVMIAIVVAQNVQPSNTAGPKNMASNGIVLTGQTSYEETAAIPNKGVATPVTYTNDGKAHITTYIDFQCPFCLQFETTNDSQIMKWLEDGKATLEVHPVAILDASSQGNKYSTRSANAAACVANYDPSAFFGVMQEFYKNQPAENTNGRTDAQILSYLASAGASSTQITDCVHNQTYKGWVTTETNQFIKDPLPNLTTQPTQLGTPTVIVNGKQYTGAFTDATGFEGFVEQASGVTLS